MAFIQPLVFRPGPVYDRKLKLNSSYKLHKTRPYLKMTSPLTNTTNTTHTTNKTNATNATDTTDTTDIAANTCNPSKYSNPPNSLHLHSPLIHSPYISNLTNLQSKNNVYLKLDNIQPSGSFKIRGHGHLVQVCKNEYGVKHFISSSGGNAGAAVAYAGRIVGARVTIVVPSSTPEFMIERLRREEAEVIVHGDVWDVADEYARELAEKDKESKHVSPFDDKLLWEGHSTLIEEIVEDLNGKKPSGIVVSVGGGGLLLGVAEGLRKVGWDDVKIIGCETEGAESFGAMVKAGGHVVELEEISSIAKSLGALKVSEKCGEWVREGRSIVPIVVSDKEAVEGCSVLAVQHRILVEAACGAAIAGVCGGKLEGKIEGDGAIVVIVCGGNMVSPEVLKRWIQETGAMESKL